MVQHNDKGTKKDLVLYHIDTAKSDCRAARLLLHAKEFRGTNLPQSVCASGINALSPSHLQYLHINIDKKIATIQKVVSRSGNCSNTKQLHKIKT